MAITREPRQNRSVRTKRRILDTGKVLFAERGYDGIHAGTIADCANVAVGTFYAYFADKHDLLVAVAQDYRESTESGERAALLALIDVSEGDDVEETIRRFLHFTLENHRKDGPLLREFLRLAPRDEDIAAILASLDDMVCESLERILTARLSISPQRATKTAAVIYTAAEGVIHTLALEPGKLNEEIALETLTAMIARLFV